MRVKAILLGTAAALLANFASACPLHNTHAANHHKAAHAHKLAATKPVVKEIEVAAIGKNSCSIFGDNFLNIPGTSSCVKIYGRVDGVIWRGGNLAPSFFAAPGEKENKKHFSLDTQGRLGFETFTPTALGNLHAVIEARGDLGNGLNYIDYGILATKGPQDYYHGNNLTTALHFAYAELGGLRFGVDESIFNNWAGNFGGVDNDNILNPLAYAPLASISYRHTHQNITTVIGLESIGNRANIASFNLKKNEDKFNVPKFTNPETANIVAGLKFSQPWGDLIALGAYDGYFKKSSAKLRIDGNISKQLTVFGMAAVKSIKDSILVYDKDNTGENKPKLYTRYSLWSPYGDWDGSWETIAGASYVVNPKVTFNAQFGYSAAKTKAASANFVYQIAKGFSITPEISYVSWNDDKTFRADDVDYKNKLNGKHQVQALLELCYKF